MKLAENISLSNQFPKEIDFWDVRQYKLQLSDIQILITKLSHFRKCTWWLQVRRCGWGHSLWKSERQPSFIHCFLVFPLQSKKKVSVHVLMIFFFSISTLFHFLMAQVRSGHAIRLFSNWGEEGLQQSFGRDGQIWLGSDCQIVSISTVQLSSFNLGLRTVLTPVSFCLSGRSSVRFLEPRTEPRWRCTRVKSSWRRMEGRSARLRKMRSSS